MTRYLTLCSIVLTLAAHVSAKEITIGTQCSSPFADCEVSTNVSFNVHRSDTKLLDVRIDAAMAVDAAVSVAFGADADADGELASEEIEFVIGMSGGNCFIEDVASGRRYYDWVASRDGSGSYVHFSVSNDGAFNPMSASVTCEKGELFTSIGAQPWMFKRSWNLMKITRRGNKSVKEVCRVDSKYRAMMLIFR